MKGFLINSFLALGGLGVLGFVISRIFPDEKVKSAGKKSGKFLASFFKGLVPAVETFGKTITTLGRSRFGVKFWEWFEDQLQHSIDLFYFSFIEEWRKNISVNLFELYYTALKRGWNYDNNAPKKVKNE